MRILNDNTRNHLKNCMARIRKLSWKRIGIAAGAVFAVLLLLFAGTIWHLISTAPDIGSITVSPTESATYICDEDGNYLRKLTLASSNRDIVTLDEIPKTLQYAVIAIEDERFYTHNGIDLKGVARAFLTGITSGSFSEGASTITQQLIKNNVFTEWTQENSFRDRFVRKIQEQYLALQLEKQMSKEEILEDYLNTINLGAGCYGVQAAARRYFGKEVSELTLSESAVLAAIPQNPTGYNPITFPEENQSRQTLILEYMEKQGYITEEEKREALADDVYTRISVWDAAYEEESAYSWYEDALIEQVIDALEELGYSSEQAYRAVYSGGLRIYSAQDQALQEICDEEFLNEANYPEGTEYGIDYALSVADETGLVTNYGSEALRSYIRETADSAFDLMCSSEEQARTYADAFRAYILGDAANDSDSQDADGSDAGAGNAPAADADDKTDNTGSLEVIAERLTLSPQPQTSLVLIDQQTGFVRAIVGGRGEKTASLTLNRATETKRQPGSTFKILAAYAPALDAYGQTLATLYENEEYSYENGTPVSNWDVTDYSGIVTIREAITRSINVIAVKCITEITPRAGFNYLLNFGFTTLHETYESESGTASDVIQPLALGGITEGVTNLELCAAYAAIANGGVYNEPKFFTKILDRYGDVVIDYSEETEESTGYAAETSRRVLQESTAFLLTSAMQDVVSDPSGTAYGSIFAAGQPIAGKTGTTSSYKDIWFVGYTPYYTCSVWGGYDNNDELPAASTCHTYNRILWSAVMNRIHESLPAAAFTQPDSVVSVTLCSESHLPAVEDACPDTYEEYFAAGTEPEELCSLHEPKPETESITIYPEIFDQLTTEAESETETEETTETDTSGAETDPDGFPEGTPGIGDEAQPEQTETETSKETESETAQPDTSSFDDLMNRLIGETGTYSGQGFSLP